MVISDLRVAYGSSVVIDGFDLILGGTGSQVTALLGASGCGKSTLIRAVAGLEHPAAGAISFDGVDLIGVPVHRRDIGIVFQDAALLPGRSVGWNVAYGLRTRRWSRRSVTERVAELLELVGLAGFADRPVGALSGGQAQRVALARALAPRPRLLLLDEPLSALDRLLRERLAGEIAEILRRAGTPTILVTHDHQEAAVIADRIAVMDRGRIVQSGTPDQVWRNPIDESVARFIGCTTVVSGDYRDGAVHTAVGPIPLPGAPADLATPVLVGLRARSLLVDDSRSSAITARVHAVTVLPDDVVVEVEFADGQRAQAVSAASVARGDQVRLRVDPDRVAVIG
ncbi:ABC transporter ATP-binding protein [Williamsia sp. CHRR-6]|uniref:ABC transporter ATP-binding protein n=1 Tax=Williamsia sp. CHRR-6 TaxID=2835871 RepID=UPI0020246594|nr:ABC transporter ATP-binding protein [Williamsia sp. CHRR-6]